MKSAEQFQAFYSTILAPVVSAIEADRKAIVKKIYIAAMVAVGLVILSSVFGEVSVTKTKDGLTSYSGGISDGLFYVVGAGVLGYFFWFRPKNKDFKARFKSEVIGRIVKFTDESLEYNPTAGISQSEFEQSAIFDWAGHRYLCEDLVSGKIGQTAVRFSEVHTQRKQEMGGDGDGNGKFHRWVTLFKGVIFIADFNKHFKGRTMVLTDQFFQNIKVKRDPVVRMENADFEKAFVVHSSDAVEAHYILTPSLMERMMSLYAKTSRVQFAFYDSIVCIALPIKENLFEASVFSSVIGETKIERYFDQLKRFTGIVEELNLNTRIWTKE